MLYYYKNIPLDFKHFFPTFINTKEIDNSIQIDIEYIYGIPLYFMYKNKTMTISILNKILQFLELIHSYDKIIINISENDVKDNYIKKLKERFI